MLRRAGSMASKTLGNATGNGIEEEWGSLKLRKLAQQLCSYKPPRAPWCNNDQDNESGEGGSNSELYVAGKRVKRSAVLVGLFEGSEGDLRVILTQRSGNLSLHSGDVSLPGGKMEEKDKDESETALREAKEEIGLDPSHVKVVTTLEPHLSKYLLKIVPVVGLLPDRKSFRPVLNPGEVDAIFDAPLEMFLKDENYRSEEKQWMGFNYTDHYFDFQTENMKFLIWGITARILVRAASVIYQRQPSFSEVVPNFSGIQSSNSRCKPKL
uniref:Nudix hydrolase domain-containing protein n=1 Tax=Picea sitchensis TaxID=3332 RepID=A9NNL0_PICSI|nr:unknown [Picea sitchensis]